MKKVSIEVVIFSLAAQANESDWANKTNSLAIDYVKHLGDVYGDSWYSGKLPLALFETIHLPTHDHLGASATSLFPDDTVIGEAVSHIEKLNKVDYQACLTHIKSLKQNIKAEGFNSTLILVVINSTLKHVDGLHRILALGMLLREGFEYEPIDVFICDNTRKS